MTRLKHSHIVVHWSVQDTVSLIVSVRAGPLNLNLYHRSKGSTKL